MQQVRRKFVQIVSFFTSYFLRFRWWAGCLQLDATASDREVLAVIARIAEHCQTAYARQCQASRGQDAEVNTHG